MDPKSRAQAVLNRDIRAASRLMSDLDDERPEAIETLGYLYAHTGRAYVLGVTGSPGVGKSTLTDVLVRALRDRGASVGVVAVDPSSPFTGGAILGDRIRMQKHAGDAGVFIRSLATRGALGGLSRSTREVASVLDAMGFDVVIIETVGVGQDEVDVVRTAHTSLVVTVPGLGDDVQAAKAGLLEIADLFVLNKADRPDADRAARYLERMLELDSRAGRGWSVPVVSTVATRNEGVGDLMAAVDRHRLHLHESGAWGERMRARRRAEIMDRVMWTLHQRARRTLEAHGGIDALVDAIERGESDPYTAAREILASVV